MRTLKLLVILTCLVFVGSALAADLTDTTWDLKGKTRMWGHKAGKNFGKNDDSLTFYGGDATAGTDPSFEFTTSPLVGTWSDAGGRRVTGHVDETAFELAIEDFINNATGATDANVIEVRKNRIWGHVNRDGQILKLKVRVKVWYEIPSQEVERSGAWIKSGFKGKLDIGAPGGE